MWNDIVNYIYNLPAYFIASLSIMVGIIILSVVVGKKVDKLDARKTPGKFLTAVITFVEMINNFVKQTIGKHWRYLTPIVISISLYIFISNISGIAGVSSPTRFTTITFSLSIIAFVVVQSMGFVSQGFKSLLGLFKPFAPMFPLNLMSEVTPILSMALRLFGNIASGTVIMTLIYEFTGWASLLVAPPFHLVFDIAFGLIQTVVFVLLIVIFSSSKVAESDLDIA